MKIFFDCEFTGLHKDTSLISIGLISEDDRKFYAEINDYDKTQLNPWIDEHVINNLCYNNLERYIPKLNIFKQGNYATKDDLDTVGKKLKTWLDQFDTVEFVSDVCHYDFVLLIDLVWRHALNMPYGIIGSACHDINQDIARYYNISSIEAFDKSREEILKEHNAEVKLGVKHNALYDAKVIKELYKILNKEKVAK